MAVRSSATGEEGRDASFADMDQTITNVTGEDALVDAIAQCWMSLFTPRVITYRASRGFTADPEMAVVVQQMIAAEAAGLAFTSDASTGASDHVVVEAAFGQGEVVASGKFQPDTYVINKQTLQVLDTRIGFKAFKIVRGPDGHDTTVDLDYTETEAQVLDEEALRRIAELAIATERHNGCPQEVEWAISSRTVWLVQARPITAWGQQHVNRLTEDPGHGSAAADGSRWISQFTVRQVASAPLDDVLRWLDSSIRGLSITRRQID